MESLASALWLLITQIVAIGVKLYLLKKVFSAATSQKNNLNANPAIKSLLFLVTIVIVGDAFGSFTWIVKLIRKIFLPDMSPYPVLWFLRLAWAFDSIEYLALSLLIEKIINKNFKLAIRHYVMIAVCTLISVYLLTIAFLHYYITDLAGRYYEYIVYKYILFYILTILFTSVILTIKHLYHSRLPKILQHQLKILLVCLLIPHIFLMLISCSQFIFSAPQVGIADNYIFIGLNNLFFTYMLYFCARRMVGLRFLSITNHVQALQKYNFIDDFKNILKQLSYVSSAQELQHISKSFFQHAFTMEAENVQLYLRDLEDSSTSTAQKDGALHTTTKASPVIEQEIASENNPNKQVVDYLAQHKILIRDEIEFNYFYEADPLQKKLIDLLNNADAHIFLPLYEKQTIVAYIIIRRNARPHTLFSNIERDEMLVFASYLSTIIYFLRHRNIKTLIQQEKELKEELYFKHQEIHHYKESIRTLLKAHSTQKIGILYYKNRSLICSNTVAIELLYGKSDKEMEPHYELALKKLASDVKKYGSDRKINLKDAHGNPLICTASLSNDKIQVLLLVFYPHIADTFTIPFNTLKDLSSWDYAIYLETTKSGQLINQLIPSSSEAMLNFKIELLKVAFSRESTLIELPDHDILPVVKIIHHISLRTILHTIVLTQHDQSNEVALQLFGIDPLFAPNAQESLLEKLSTTGTIFIQNVELLSIETQERLLAYLNSGMYQSLKSDRKKSSHVRIIFSTNNNLELLVQQGTFSAEFLKKIKKTSLTLPSLLTIPQQELTELAQRFSEQAIKNKEINALISLDEKDTHKIINQRPTSLYEFKERIQSALLNKSTKNKIEHVVEFNSSYMTEEPELAHAIRLGKHALKDKYIMRLLWNKFQNQTKIATLLNVNRSSVNRRCKEFQLIGEHE